MESTPEVLDPPVMDDSGYCLKDRDLSFLGLDSTQLSVWRGRRSPLGMDEPTYREFRRTLFRALELDGALDADVRLQGSASHFYSGPHKSMPYDRSEVIAEYVSARRTSPSAFQVTRITGALAAQWQTGDRPARRPFDALHRVDLHPEPSDYDIQISSRALMARVEDAVRFIGGDPARIQTTGSYNFLDRAYVRDHLLYMSMWESRAEELVGRPVALAIFDRTGPPDTRGADGRGISSHFKPTDWIIEPPDEVGSRASHG